MSSIAAIHNIIADQGATFTYAFVKKDSENRVVPLTGYTARMQVRGSVSSTTATLNLTTENGYLTIDAFKGAIMVEVPYTVMTNILPEKYVYDLEIIDDEDSVERLVMGTFTVRAEVTR
jgi:hypothetical protein